MKFASFSPAPVIYPRPRVPVLPDRPWPVLSGVRRRPAASAQGERQGGFRHFTRGRYALGEAYRLSGVGPGGALLAPAYHCVTMLDPALALGANIVLYPLNRDLTPDAECLDALLAGYGKPVKALLATHFFGFARDFGWLARWCAARDIALIEDCSHTLLTEDFQAEGTGNYGRFVTASPYKFFACVDGGLLFAAEAHRLAYSRTRAAGLLDELRGLKHLAEKAWRPAVGDDAGRDALPPVFASDRFIERVRPSAQYVAAQATRASLLSSRLVVRCSSIADIIRRRRNNYRRWAQAVAGLDNGRALFAELPAATIPYMFPLRLRHPDTHFHRLKHAGLPIWRWDEMAVSACPTAGDYRLRLIHLPCHQALSDTQMDWMIGTLRRVLDPDAGGGA